MAVPRSAAPEPVPFLFRFLIAVPTASRSFCTVSMSAFTVELADAFSASKDFFTSEIALFTALVPPAVRSRAVRPCNDVFNAPRSVHTAPESDDADDAAPLSELLSELLEQAPRSAVLARRATASTAADLRGRIM